jgi:hypothetical protein
MCKIQKPRQMPIYRRVLARESTAVAICRRKSATNERYSIIDRMVRMCGGAHVDTRQRVVVSVHKLSLNTAVARSAPLSRSVIHDRYNTWNTTPSLNNTQQLAYLRASALHWS